MNDHTDGPIEALVRSIVREELDRRLAEQGTAPPELLRIPDAARRLGIGRTQLYALVGSGEVRSLKLGGRRVIPATEVARLAESATNGAHMETPRPKPGRRSRRRASASEEEERRAV
jgi:excisionase family DNA binding protein